MLDEKRLERCAWASFFIGNNQWLVEDGNTRGMVCSDEVSGVL